MQIIVSSTFSPEIYEQCHSDQAPPCLFENVEEIAGDIPLPPDVVIDAPQQSEPSPHPPSPSSTTASEDATSEDHQDDVQLVSLGSYQVHPSASGHARSIPICLGMVLTEQTANSMGIPWDTVKTHWFNWDTEEFRDGIKDAIITQISYYNYKQEFQQGDEDGDEDETLETQGGKRKHVDVDSTANKRLHLDLDASIESIKDVELDMKVSQFCFGVAVTDHRTVVASKTMALNPTLCSAVNLLYRQKCVYYNYKITRVKDVNLASSYFGKTTWMINKWQ